MARFCPLKVFAASLGLAALVPLGFAQSTQTGASTAPRKSGAAQGVTAASSPVFSPAPSEKAPPPPTAQAPKRSRAISSDVAAALAAASPKYTPAPPKPEPKPESELVDLREVDKPKNQIIRLPEMVVREQKPVIFTERAIHTEKGLTEIAMRRYMSEADRALNRFTLPLFGSSMEARAMAMYAEDERLRNMADLEDAAQTASKSDAATGTYIRREAQKTYLRSSDFGWNGGASK